MGSFDQALMLAGRGILKFPLLEQVWVILTSKSWFKENNNKIESQKHNFKVTVNEILLLDDVLVFHSVKENSFIKYLHNF